MFYVYIHRRADDNSVFYVGKGVSGRAYETHKSKRSAYWIRVFEKHGRTVEIIKDNLSEFDALELEKLLISQYGMNNLCNFSTGGESGGSGRIWTIESRKKLSESKKGKKQPWAGTSLTESGRQKIRESKLGKSTPWTIGEKNPMKNKETVKKVADAQRGQKRISVAGSKNGSARSIRCIDTGVVFHTMKDAGEWVKSKGLTISEQPHSNICSACSGKLKSAYKHKWEYV